MKIALVAPTFLPARRANTIQVMKMAQALAALGHEVRVLVPGRPERPHSWEDLARHYGLQRRFLVEWLPAHPRLRSYDYGLRAYLRARRWGADLVYTRLPQTATLASLGGTPTIFEMHDLPGGRVGPPLLRLFLKGRGARRLVLITRALAEHLSRRLGVRLDEPFALIAPDGVDLERYDGLPSPAEARASLGLDARRFTAGYTGHLYAGRGAGLILELAARLPGIDFLLVGGEPQEVSRFRRSAASRELENVRLTGFVPNAELPRYQAASDVLLMPYERSVAASSGGDIAPYLSPMKVFEYLACGRPVLSSDLPVLREVLNDENAVLLPPEDPAAWTAALQALQADPERRRRLSGCARQSAGRYSWENRARTILEGL